jgi:P-type Ca2+ transporter type 2C
MDPARGLDSAEAARRLAATGPNALPAPRGRGLIRFVLEVFEEPIFGLLVGAALLYVAIGDAAEGLLLAGCAGVSVALVAVQSWRSERVLTALRGVIAPRAHVVRDGAAHRIPAAEIVPGDIVVLAAGDRVPADGIVRQGAGLVVDESALTGESIPVRKLAAAAAEPSATDTAMATPGGDDTPFIYSGTLVLAGEGLAEIVATGPRSRIGAIGSALAVLRWPATPLQLATTRFVRRLAVVALALALALAVLRALRDGDWLGGALAGITLAMSAIPEELPMVLAIFLAVGGWRLSRHGVLARQPSAVLALGATTVLCVDKTGTITENAIRLERAAIPGAEASAGDARNDPRFAALCAAALRAVHPQGGDPMDRATLALGTPPSTVPLREYPLVAGRPRVAFAWPDGDGVLIAAKGAPETIAALCRLDGEALSAMQAQLRTHATEGLRVLAVAQTRAAAVPEEIEGLDFVYLGLLAFGDPVRESARGSVADCRAAGIDVVMITGDHPATAAAIARAAGIETGGKPLTGGELAALDGAALGDAVAGKRVFARTEPGQKLRIVEALQARGHVVAMTGDGVNDAPALRAAHVGVAMGTRGTDVAREAAGLVVLNDDLGSIVSAIRLGRRIADNMRKAMVFVVAIHIPLIGLALLPALLGWPLLLSPVHVIFLELFIDPTCAIVFESLREEPGAMRRPPRRARDAVVSSFTIAVGAVQGAALLGVVAGLYGWGLHAGIGVEAARALAFVALVAGTLGLALTNLSWGRSALAPAVLSHPAFVVAAVATTALLVLLLAWPSARSMFGFALPPAQLVAAAAALGLGATLWFEIVKLSGVLARRD